MGVAKKKADKCVRPRVEATEDNVVKPISTSFSPTAMTVLKQIKFGD
jgi:hypothetical protein